MPSLRPARSARLPAALQGRPVCSLRAGATGGLPRDGAAACMVTTAAGWGPCLVNSTTQGSFLRIVGGPPGGQAEGRPPNRDTDLPISPDGRNVVNVTGSGPPR